MAPVVFRRKAIRKALRGVARLESTGSYSAASYSTEERAEARLAVFVAKEAVEGTVQLEDTGVRVGAALRYGNLVRLRVNVPALTVEKLLTVTPVRRPRLLPLLGVVVVISALANQGVIVVV